MRNDRENVIVNLTLEFALEIIEYSELLEEKRKFVIARQLLNAGTSIGANVREAQNAESKADFIHKIKIAAKEADETEYWLLLCSLSKTYPKNEQLYEKIKTIIKILSKIISSSKADKTIFKFSNRPIFKFSNQINFMKPEELKKAVKSKYEGIVLQSTQGEESCCCGSTNCCEEIDYSVFSDDYTNHQGYNPEADLGLGCGIPTDFAGIKEGDSVLDLGSGAGNDVFVARSLVGESGKVTGLDFTEAMVNKARENLLKTGYSNIEFVHGDIENMPLEENAYNVVISNCVLNLVPDKSKAFREIMRVLKPGGHFCISDVVLIGNIPTRLREEVELYAGCVSGALPKEEYLGVIGAQGFSEITVHKEKQIAVPGELIEQYLGEEELRDFRSGLKGIYSITVSGRKG